MVILKQMKRAKADSIIALVDGVPLIFPEFQDLSGEEARIAMANMYKIGHG